MRFVVLSQCYQDLDVNANLLQEQNLGSQPAAPCKQVLHKQQLISRAVCPEKYGPRSRQSGEGDGNVFLGCEEESQNGAKSQRGSSAHLEAPIP